jgi:tetratricopeptide (TPR) repeat protein
MKKRYFVAVLALVTAAGLFTGCLSSGDMARRENDYYNQGGTAYFNKDWDMAIAMYTSAIQIAPSKEAYNWRGWAYLQIGDSVRAENDFSKALRIDPSYENAKNGLGHARAPHAAFLLYQEVKNAPTNDLAIEKLSQAIVLFPDYAAAYHERGTRYFRKKMYDEAVADFKKTMEIDPKHGSW